MSDHRDKVRGAPSAWIIEKVLQIAHERLHIQAVPNAPPTDAEELLEELRREGADVASIMRRLLLATTEARADLTAIRSRIDDLVARKVRRVDDEERYRKTALFIMQQFPELFPNGKFKDPVVSARIEPGKTSVDVLDLDLLNEEFVTITRVANKGRIQEALLAGEVVNGADWKTGEDYLVVRAK